MKKLIIIIPLLIVAIGALGQAPSSSPLTQITSQVLGDQIWLRRGAKEMTNLVITPNGDIARSVDYALTFYRDTLNAGYATVYYYNAGGSFILQENIPFNQSGYNKWAAFLTPLDLFIHVKRPLIILH